MIKSSMEDGRSGFGDWKTLKTRTVSLQNGNSVEEDDGDDVEKQQEDGNYQEVLEKWKFYGTRGETITLTCNISLICGAREK